MNRSRCAPYLVILLFVFVTHGLLLLNDGVYWDDWLWINLPDYSLNLANITTTYDQMGFLPTNWVHLWLFNIFGFRLVEFLSLALAGVLVYQTCRELSWNNDKDGLLISLLFLSYPAYQTWIVFSTANYVFYYTLFLLAVFLSIKAERVVGVGHYALRVSSLVLFALSYNLNSLLVFYFGFLLVLFMTRRSLAITRKHALLHFLTHRLDYALLPFVFWAAKGVFFPRHGLYVDYNQFNLSVISLLLSLKGFLITGIVAQFVNPIAGLLPFTAIWVLAIVITLWAYRSSEGSPNWLSGDNSFRLLNRPIFAYAPLCFGLLLLGLGMAPYVLVGLSPTVHGWSTRHSLLLGLPMALIIIALLRLAATRPNGPLSRPGAVVMVTLTMAFSLATVSNYVDWQARWVKDSSIMANLSALNEPSQASVYWIVDEFPVGGESEYRFYEWSSMFEQVWGDESRLGLDAKIRTSNFLVTFGNYFSKKYNLSDFDPTGPQALLTVRRGDIADSNFELAARYLLLRFFNPGELGQFLRQVTQVEIQPLSTS